MTSHYGEHPPHETCVETTTLGELAQGKHSYVCGLDCPPKTDLRPHVTTYDEWRVTGTWPEDGKPFDVQLWRSDQCNAGAEARKWAEWARATGVTDGPHLHKRTVTVTDWTEVDT